jgi:hypothetical protein
MGLTVSEKRSSSTFVLSLVGGILIIFGSALTQLMFGNFHSRVCGQGGGMMCGMTGGMMSWWGSPAFMGGWFFSIPLISGILVVLAAIMLNIRPQETTTWGIVVLIFSIIGFTGMSLSILGGILGIIGGAIALSKGSSR